MSLLGVNGAGKSTLSTIIAALHPPTAGDILYRGESIYHDIPDYRAHIGFCPQHPNLNDNLTIEQNLYFAGLAYRLDTRAAHSRAQELLKTFKLEMYKSSKPSVLSGGYKQRALLARTLMHEPSLILLDEPTVGLDPHIRYELWDVIKSLRDRGTSIVLTTHYIEEAEQLSDRVCVLDQGVIKLVGTPQSLKTSYAKNTLESVFLELTNLNKKASQGE
jgi:ABC-type multidrug transport system ATPase subunit